MEWINHIILSQQKPTHTAQYTHNKQQMDNISEDRFYWWLLARLFQNLIEDHLSACGRRTEVRAFQLTVPSVQDVWAACDWEKSDQDRWAQIASLYTDDPGAWGSIICVYFWPVFSRSLDPSACREAEPGVACADDRHCLGLCGRCQGAAALCRGKHHQLFST